MEDSTVQETMNHLSHRPDKTLLVPHKPLINPSITKIQLFYFPLFVGFKVAISQHVHE